LRALSEALTEHGVYLDSTKAVEMRSPARAYAAAECAAMKEKKSLHCTQKFHATNIHIEPGSAVLSCEK
jgi:hypothetical protein